mgnify:CR=1 FL=1
MKVGPSLIDRAAAARPKNHIFMSVVAFSDLLRHLDCALKALPENRSTSPAILPNMGPRERPPSPPTRSNPAVGRPYSEGMGNMTPFAAQERQLAHKQHGCIHYFDPLPSCGHKPCQDQAKIVDNTTSCPPKEAPRARCSAPKTTSRDPSFHKSGLRCLFEPPPTGFRRITTLLRCTDVRSAP